MNLAEMSYYPEKLEIVWDNDESSRFHSNWLYERGPQPSADSGAAVEAPRITRAMFTGAKIQVCWDDGNAAQFGLDWLYEHRPGKGSIPF